MLPNRPDGIADTVPASWTSVAHRSTVPSRRALEASHHPSACRNEHTGDRALTKQSYRFRLCGLDEAEGHINVDSLIRTLKALVKTAESATRLAATGRSSGRGAKPRWLKAALDFTVTGLEVGSTTLTIDAPRLGDIPDPELAQQDLWIRQPSAEDTSLDLGARATAEVQSSAAPGDYFDGNVLRAILGLGKAVKTRGVRYELSPENRAGTGFVLEASDCAAIEERLHLIPAPRAFVVSGRLDEIGHGLGRFRLLLDGGSLPGRLDRTHLDVELLRPLWGKRATVQGVVHFKSNGLPRLIEARRISGHAEGDMIFETMPEAEAGVGKPADAQSGRERPTAVSSAVGKAMRRVDPMILWGTWPGDESIEELLAQFD